MRNDACLIDGLDEELGNEGCLVVLHDVRLFVRLKHSHGQPSQSCLPNIFCPCRVYLVVRFSYHGPRPVKTVSVPAPGIILVRSVALFHMPPLPSHLPLHPHPAHRMHQYAKQTKNKKQNKQNNNNNKQINNKDKTILHKTTKNQIQPTK